MRLHSALTKSVAGCLVLLATLVTLMAINIARSSDAPEGGAFPSIALGLTTEARESLQLDSRAFPSDTAGFSTYYRTPHIRANTITETYGLDKSIVDDHIFSELRRGIVDQRAVPAEVLDMGANYTIALMPIMNIGGLTTIVNVYYDDEGWIVAYLPRDAPSSQIWQARELDQENPRLTDISKTVLLDAINVILVDALQGAAIDDAADGLGYYHWQYPTADSFLMIAVTRGEQGNAPVSLAVPESLEMKEVSATLWLYTYSDTYKPCATLVLDDIESIPLKCANGIYNTSVELDAFNSQVAHRLKLTHSADSGGASGALLMLVYSQGKAVNLE